MIRFLSIRIRVAGTQSSNGQAGFLAVGSSKAWKGRVSLSQLESTCNHDAYRSRPRGHCPPCWGWCRSGRWSQWQALASPPRWWGLPLRRGARSWTWTSRCWAHPISWNNEIKVQSLWMNTVSQWIIIYQTSANCCASAYSASLHLDFEFLIQFWQNFQPGPKIRIFWPLWGARVHTGINLAKPWSGEKAWVNITIQPLLAGQSPWREWWCVYSRLWRHCTHLSLLHWPGWEIIKFLWVLWRWSPSGTGPRTHSLNINSTEVHVPDSLLCNVMT